MSREAGVEREAPAASADPRADELAHLISWHLAAGNSATVSFLRGYSALTQTNADLLTALETLTACVQLLQFAERAGVTSHNPDAWNEPLELARAAIAKAKGLDQAKEQQE